MQLVQSMYNNTRSKVGVNNTDNDEFGVTVGVHQGSVLIPFLFIKLCQVSSAH